MGAASDEVGRHRGRAVGAGSLAWGALLLLGGDRLWRLLAGDEPARVDRIAVRILGAREVAQGALHLLAPGTGRRTAAVVEALHALSMVTLALADPPRRVPAAVSAGVATATASVLLRLRRPATRSGSAS